jgi:hypothetical protein
MDLKGLLYLACGAGTVVGAMNIGRRGFAGPGTLAVFLAPLFGLIALLAIDVWNFFQFQRNSSTRRRSRLADDLRLLWKRASPGTRSGIRIGLAIGAATVLLGCLMAVVEFPPAKDPGGRAPDAGPVGRRPNRLTDDPPDGAGWPGVIAYWSFEEAGGGIAFDRSGMGHDGALVGAERGPGIRGRALRFAAEGQHLDLGPSPRLNFPALGSFTIAFWFATRDRSATILSFRNALEPGADIWIGLEADRLRALVRQDLGEAGPPAIAETDGSNDGTWRHLAVVRRGDAIELFVDGEIRSRAVSPFAAGAITTDLRAAGQERYWTRFHLRQFGNPHWVGLLDELAIFGRALEPAEIAKLAGNPDRLR